MLKCFESSLRTRIILFFIPIILFRPVLTYLFCTKQIQFYEINSRRSEGRLRIPRD